MLESGIYVVATPIGNLSDITLRALDVLKQADVIAAEDTRHTRRLLEHYDIKTKMVSFHEHNEQEKAGLLIDKAASGEVIALVSDAGTPLISDPGHVLIKEAHNAGVRVFPIPGASAVVSALSASGIACGKFIFEGFLPVKDGAKKALLALYENERKAVVFYESPHRVLSTLEAMHEVYGERDLTVARELTKQFETIRRGSLSDILNWMKADANQQKGEFVLVLSGSNAVEVLPDEKRLREVLSRLLLELPPKKAAAVVEDLYGGSKKNYYQWAVDIKNN